MLSNREDLRPTNKKINTTPNKQNDKRDISLGAGVGYGLCDGPGGV